jgi:hypothetical protein
MAVEQKKRKRGNFVINWYDCTPPDSVGLYGCNGMLLSYLAIAMTLPRSPILIPQLSYKIKLHVLRRTKTTKAESASVSPLTRAD